MIGGNLKSKVIHNVFSITILMKGIAGVFEIMIGVLFFLVRTETIYKILISITNQRAINRSGHIITNYFQRQADNFSVSTQYFIAIYFLFYGIVNMFLVISLLKGKLWAYPATMIFFSLFTVYMFYRFLLHRSGTLLFFIIFDIFLVVLTWLEYKRLKKDQAAKITDGQSLPSL